MSMENRKDTSSPGMQPVVTEKHINPEECFHCGETMPPDLSLNVMIDGELKPVCCAGCKAVAETIINFGLEKYYRYRTGLPARPDEPVPEELLQFEIYDDLNFQSTFTELSEKDLKSVHIMLEDVVCPACTWLIETRLSRLPGIENLKVNYTSNRATVTWHEDLITLGKILKTIHALGYRAYPYDPNRGQLLLERERKLHLRRLGLAGLLGMQVMMLSIAIYAGDWTGMENEYRQFFYWICLLLTTPVIIYSAGSFFTRAWRDLKLLRTGMDVPVSLGLAITSDEEQGGVSGVGYLFDGVGLRCGTAIVPDGGSLNEITIAEKGVLHLRLICLGHSSHAARPWLGDNPLEKLLERVTSLKRHFLALKHDRDHWYPTCTLTRVETPNVATNRIPSIAKADLDIRFPPPFTVDQMLGEITQVLGSHIETNVILSSEPMEFNPDVLFEKAIEEVTGEPASFIREDGASDSRFIQGYGIPVIISRPIVGELHSEDEWIDVDSMVKFYLICQRYLERKLLTG